MAADELCTSGLAVGYRRRVVLAGLDLALRTGQLVCLLGANGTGKSTLMRTLAGMRAPLTGRVTLGGDAVDTLSRAERARRLAVVLTDRPAVGGLTSAELVGLGRTPHTGWTGRLTAADRRAVRRALRLAGADPLADRPVDQLSDGERQRVMVARALAQQAPVLLLDEPTAFLDAPRRAELTGTLRDLAHAAGLAVLLSTHDIELALRTADVVWLVLPTGRVIVGAPEDLVLAGALERAFDRFDSLAGGFQAGARPAGRARLAGEPDALTAVWTRRALERCGYLVDGADPSIDVEVDCRATIDGPLWTVYTPTGRSEHGSLASLVAEIRLVRRLADSFAVSRN